MNNINYSYIRYELNKSPITDEILNRIFCPKLGNWALLDDIAAQKIKLWMKETIARIHKEKTRAYHRAYYNAKKRAREYANNQGS